MLDKEDFSVTRSDLLFKKLFAEAKLKIIKEGDQSNWPSDLYGVRMYALQP